MNDQWANHDWYGPHYPGYYPCIQRPQAYNYGHQPISLPQPSENTSLPSDHPPPPGIDTKDESRGPTTEPPSSYTSWYQAQVHPHAYNYSHDHPPIRFSIAPVTKPPDKPQASFDATQPYSVPPSSSTEAAARWNAANSGYTVYQPPPSPNVGPRPNAPNWYTPSPSSNKGPRFPFKQTFTSPSVPKTENPKDVDSGIGTPPKSQWPQEITDYVQRAFASTDKPHEKDRMERILKEKLEYIFKNKIKIDWTKEPLPVIPNYSIPGSCTPRSVNVLRPSFVPLSDQVKASKACDNSLLLRPYDASPSTLSLKPKVESSDMQSPFNRRRHSRFRRSKSGSSSSSQSRYRSRSRSGSRSRSSSASCSSRSSTNDNHRAKHSNQKYVPGYSSKRLCSHEDNRSLKRRKSNRSENGDSHPQSGARGGRGAKQCKRGRGASNSISTANSQIEVKTKNFVRGGKRGARAAVWSVDGTGLARLNQRADRFKDHLGETSSMSGAGAIARSASQLMLMFADDASDLSADLERCKIVGTLQDLEKPYLRLTRASLFLFLVLAPDPCEVRPIDVLKKSLEHVLKRWKEKADYHWACEQFKSIRQDLTVQCLEDEFTAYVYETHADVALEAGDYEEFHQCQSQLMRLHKEGFGSVRRLEFIAYRILYYMFTLDFLGITSTMASFRAAHKENPCIKFALDLRSAWSTNNHSRFFRLLSSTNEPAVPEKCRLVVDWFLSRERKEAAKTIFKVFRPTISLSFIAKSLGFDDDLVTCENFLVKECGLPAELLRPHERMDGKSIWSAFCQAS